jgi:lipopolysaccharide biosynthesis glycosyltransferase
VIHVAVAADRRYLPHAAVSLRSLLLSTSDPSSIQPHLLHGPELDRADIAALAGMVTELRSELVPLLIDGDRVDGLPVNVRFPPAIWYRTFLPDLLPDADSVVYLDCDTVLFDDIAELVTTDLQGCAVAAVDNVSLGHEADSARVGLDAATRYFNSGVLVLDLDQWRRDDLGTTVRAEARQRGWAPFPDQDALNVVLAHRRLSLPVRWNLQNSVIYLEMAKDVFGAAAVAEARRNPALVHFEGFKIDKPWHYLSKHPYRKAYLEHRAHTPWPSDVIEERTPFHRLLRPFPRRVIGRVLRTEMQLKIKQRQRRERRSTAGQGLQR